MTYTSQLGVFFPDYLIKFWLHCVQAFSSCVEWNYFLVAVSELISVVASSVVHIPFPIMPSEWGFPQGLDEQI